MVSAYAGTVEAAAEHSSSIILEVTCRSVGVSGV